jgi:hypothetical protein
MANFIDNAKDYAKSILEESPDITEKDFIQLLQGYQNSAANLSKDNKLKATDYSQLYKQVYKDLKN